MEYLLKSYVTTPWTTDMYDIVHYISWDTETKTVKTYEQTIPGCYGDDISHIKNLPKDKESFDRIKEDIRKYMEDNIAKTVALRCEQYKKECDEYNILMNPQCKGQKVVVTGGRKYKGVTGTITWGGKNMYKPQYRNGLGFRASAVLAIMSQRPWTELPYESDGIDLLRIKPESGNPFYIDKAKVRVVDGYISRTFTRECVEKMVRWETKNNWVAKLGNAYDTKNYIGEF